MSITFGSYEIPGDVLPFQPSSPELQAWRTKYAGVRGVSEIIGATGMRPIDIPIVLFGDFNSSGQLQSFLQTLDDRIGTNETVQIDSNAGQGPYDNCTLIDYQPIKMPLPDLAGLLDGGWFMYLLLRFVQLDIGG